MSTILECPKCGVSRDSDDIVITWEHNRQPGVNYSVKKIIRSTIQTSYSAMDDEETLIHTCGLCEYEWSEPVLDASVTEEVRNDPIPQFTYPIGETKVFPTFSDRDDLGMMGEAHFEFMRHVED